MLTVTVHDKESNASTYEARMVTKRANTVTRGNNGMGKVTAIGAVDVIRPDDTHVVLDDYMSIFVMNDHGATIATYHGEVASKAA